MASITGKKAIFFVTSPRSPMKMRDEIKLLIDNFKDRVWNIETQTSFSTLLSRADFFEGRIESNLDLAARDRITRAPKALGFVDLKPRIELTQSGQEFLENRPYEILTRQLLKFQLPSPYHTDRENTFKVKPYLELIRLTYELDGLSKNEIAAFFMQLISFDKYEDVKRKILSFRANVRVLDRNRTNYRRFFIETFRQEIEEQYAEEIQIGDTAIRESRENSLNKFISTKMQNHRDYADAAIRYLRATQLISIGAGGIYKIFVPNEKKKEVEYILLNTKRDVESFQDEADFKRYLFDSGKPLLLMDSKTQLIDELLNIDATLNQAELDSQSLGKLKDMRGEFIESKIKEKITEELADLKTYNKFDEIMSIYADIEGKATLDGPLFMEWNTWRALAMLDDGDIKGNFRFGDDGLPLSTAGGNMPDIECRYEDFDLLVEVTLSTGQRQYEMEGEPVARHLGKHIADTGKNTYCIFVAQSLNLSSIAHFYSLNRTPISYYGGKAKIIPLSLNDFKMLLIKAHGFSDSPKSENIKSLISEFIAFSQTAEDENDWYQKIVGAIINWE